MNTLLQIDGFSLTGKAGRFCHSERLTLDVPSFRMDIGTVTALIGGSGAGKSVFMCLLMGHPSYGIGGVCSANALRIFGQDVDCGSFRTRFGLNMAWRRICKNGFLMYMPQNFPLARSSATTVRKFMTLLLRSLLRCGGEDEAKAGQLLDNAFRRLGLASLAAKPLSALSGGERRRVELLVRLEAIKACKRETILLLDEPTTGFDPESANRFMREIRDNMANIGEKASVVLSTHDLGCLDRRDGIRVADRIAVMHRDGKNEAGYDPSCSRIVFNGDPDVFARNLGFSSDFSFGARGSEIYGKLNEHPSIEWAQNLNAKEV